MDSHNHLVNELEERLFLIVETKSVDLTCDGQVILERMSSPLSEEKKELNYYLRTPSEGVIFGQVKLIAFDEMVNVEAELSIKKFIKPQLSLSSAHVAVLIHSLKSLIRRVKLQSTDGEPLSWKLDRVQRRVKLEKQVSLSLESSIWLLRQLARILTKVSGLSLEVIQEEAEYYKAIERWPYARRAYLSWHSLSTLSFDHLQDFLMILQYLKDWRACLNLLEESIERYDQHLGAKLAFAASILCKDVLLDHGHSIVLMQRALELDPENGQYELHLEALLTRDSQDELTSKKASEYEIESKKTSEDELDLELPNQEPSFAQEQDDNFDPFFDEQSMTSDQLKPITDESQEIAQEVTQEFTQETVQELSEPAEDETTKQTLSSVELNKPPPSKAAHKAKRTKKQKSKNKKRSKKRSGKKR